MSQFILTESLPNIPWEDKPEKCQDVMWRYSKNPIITNNDTVNVNGIYNSAVVPFKDGFAGVFRCDTKAMQMTLRAGTSKDGINFEIENESIDFICDDPEIKHFIEGYDPRIVQLDDKYYITWCNNYHGYTIGMAWTTDFKKFHQLENALLPFNRNAVLFPRKVNGEYAMLSRPSDASHTPFGDIFYSSSPDLTYWGKHRHVMSPRGSGEVNWEMTKIGAGPIPIETSEGWLLIYHGVITTCNGFSYSMGACLLDIDQPWNVLYRSRVPLVSPDAIYERVGHVPNVVFPCAALTDADTGRIAVYSGCADSCTSIAFSYIDDLLIWIKENSRQ